MSCEQCEWWADPKRPHETFRMLAWEWDVDRARTMEPAERGDLEVARIAEIVDYPPVPGVIRPLRVPVDPEHVGHVDLAVPVILGVWSAGNAMVIDGHHRIARAVRDGVEKLPYVLLGEAQLKKCEVRRPPRRRKR